MTSESVSRRMLLQVSGESEALQQLRAISSDSWNFGLDRTRALMERLGNPERAFPSFHVAGTNGKGSSVATLVTLLQGNGLRVGGFTSPHFRTLRERVRIDGLPIPIADIERFADRHASDVVATGASFFEVLTALGLWHFADRGVDAAVIETGLGGRLDSTNVVHPIVAGVTTIGMDHVEYLGDTLEAIAREKAGIFKRGAAAVIGERDLTIRRFLLNEAVGAGASHSTVVWEHAPPRDILVTADGTQFTIEDEDGRRHTLTTPLLGEHQAANTAFAIAMLREGAGRFWPGWDRVARSLDSVRIPGRFQRIGDAIFDVAHNPDGVGVLAATLRAVRPPKPIVAVLCILGDKDWRRMIELLADVVDHIVLTDAPTAPQSRRWPIDEVLAYAERGERSVSSVPDFDHALSFARERGSTIVVTGSFHTVGDAMARLQVDPLAG